MSTVHLNSGELGVSAAFADPDHAKVEGGVKRDRSPSLDVELEMKESAPPKRRRKKKGGRTAQERKKESWSTTLRT